MVKQKEEITTEEEPLEVEEELVEEREPTGTQETLEVEAEDIEAIKTQLQLALERIDSMQEEIEQAEKGHKSLQRIISEREEELNNVKKQTPTARPPSATEVKKYMDAANQLWARAKEARLSEPKRQRLATFLQAGNLAAANELLHSDSEWRERLESAASEKSRQWMEEQGLLESEAGGPSAGGGGSFESIEQRYAKGEVGSEVYKEARKRAGK